MKKVFALVAVATLFFSCQKEKEFTDSTPTSKFSFKASIEELGSTTKATIDDSYQFLWSKGDKIGIFTDGDKVRNPFTLEGDGGSKSGQFNYSGEGTFERTDASGAYFPWQDNPGNGTTNIWESVFYVQLPEFYTDYTSGQMLTPLVAPVSYNSTDYDPIEFKHAGAAVKVTINNLPAGAHSIGMTADQQLFGSFQINVADAGTATMTANNATGDAGNKTVWLNYEPADAAREFTFVFPVPGLVKPKLSFVIYDENGVVVWEKKLKAQAEDLGHADILVMPAIDITPYEKLNAISPWFVRGTMDGNAWVDFQMMTDGRVSIAKGIPFTASGEFKVSNGNDWYPDANYAVTTAGTYDVIFDNNTHDIKLVQSGKCPYPGGRIAIDGNFDDWNQTGVVSHTGMNDRIKEWKSFSDESNVYFYYKITKSKIKYDSDNGNYDTGASTIYVGFDLDKDASTGNMGEYGGSGTSSTITESGLEAVLRIHPWTGTTENSPEIASKLYTDSWYVKPVSVSNTYVIPLSGSFEGDYAYIEFSIPRSALGSPASGSSFIVNHAMQYYPTGRTEITLN